MIESADRTLPAGDGAAPAAVLSRQTPWAWRSLASAVACLVLVGVAFFVPGEGDAYVTAAGVIGLLALGCAILGIGFAALGAVRREGWGCLVGAVACVIAGAPAAVIAGVLLLVTSPID